MHAITTPPPRWTDRQYVSPDEAAGILCRPGSWIRDQILRGRLHLGPQTWPLQIATVSIVDMLVKQEVEKAAGQRAKENRAKKGRSRRPQHLRLVVDNTAP